MTGDEERVNNHAKKKSETAVSKEEANEDIYFNHKNYNFLD